MEERWWSDGPSTTVALASSVPGFELGKWLNFSRLFLTSAHHCQPSGKAGQPSPSPSRVPAVLQLAWLGERSSRWTRVATRPIPGPAGNDLDSRAPVRHSLPFLVFQVSFVDNVLCFHPLGEACVQSRCFSGPRIWLVLRRGFSRSRWRGPEYMARCASRPGSDLGSGGPALLGSMSDMPRIKGPLARSGLTMLASWTFRIVSCWTGGVHIQDANAYALFGQGGGDV